MERTPDIKKRDHAQIEKGAWVSRRDRDDVVWFDAELYPYRSLSRLGFLILMTVLSGLAFGIGVIFYMQGAWPVFGFMGLDILLLYGAFRVNYAAAKAVERIRLTGNVLTVTRINHRGQQRDWRFNPYWVRVALDRPPNVPETIDETFIKISSHGRGLYVGDFLHQAERRAFLDALQRALRDCRRRHFA